MPPPRRSIRVPPLQGRRALLRRWRDPSHYQKPGQPSKWARPRPSGSQGLSVERQLAARRPAPPASRPRSTCDRNGPCQTSPRESRTGAALRFVNEPRASSAWRTAAIASASVVDRTSARCLEGTFGPDPLPSQTTHSRLRHHAVTTTTPWLSVPDACSRSRASCHRDSEWELVETLQFWADRLAGLPHRASRRGPTDALCAIQRAISLDHYVVS